jgi:hypothetical protein
MMRIPYAAHSHLIAAVVLELAKTIDIGISLGDDDDWPPDFDPNDKPIFKSILKTLLNSEPVYGSDYELGLIPNSKTGWFMVMLIPAYVEKMLKNDKLTHEGYTALKQVYSDYKGNYGSAQFPEWPPA